MDCRVTESSESLYKHDQSLNKRQRIPMDLDECVENSVRLSEEDS